MELAISARTARYRANRAKGLCGCGAKRTSEFAQCAVCRIKRTRAWAELRKAHPKARIEL